MSRINSLAELIQSFYGIATTPRINRTASQAGTTATKIANNDPKRVYFNVVNLSANDVYLMLDNTVDSTKGIYLSPNGGSMTLRWIDDFNLLEHEWYAIAIGAAANILVIEGEIL